MLSQQNNLTEYLLAEQIAEILGEPLYGSPSTLIKNIATNSNFNADSIIFSDKELSSEVAFLISKKQDKYAKSGIVVDNPKKYMRLLLSSLNLPSFNSKMKGIHESAIVSKNASIGHNVTIGAYSIIEDDVCIMDDCVIDANVHIMPAVHVGKNTYIGSGVVIYAHVYLGDRVIVGANSVLGDAGFGYDWDSQWLVFPQIGRLQIGNDVHIGPLSVIDRGAISDTTIASGSKLDALIMIGHGVQIGSNVIMAAASAVGGSSNIGDMTISGGCVQISDHVNIAPGSKLAGGTSVASSLRTAGEYVSALPAMKSSEWRKFLRFVLRLIKS